MGQKKAVKNQELKILSETAYILHGFVMCAAGLMSFSLHF